MEARFDDTRHELVRDEGAVALSNVTFNQSKQIIHFHIQLKSHKQQ